jgi:lysozyme
MPRQAGSPKPRNPGGRRRRSRAASGRWPGWALALAALLLIPLLIFLGRHLVLRQRWIYPSLGVEIPPGYGAVGMDLSRWNGRVHWGDVPGSAVRLDFVWLKATEGGDWRDSQYERNRSGAAELGIRSGAYHFFRPAGDPRQQARFFWKRPG